MGSTVEGFVPGNEGLVPCTVSARAWGPRGEHLEGPEGLQL